MAQQPTPILFILRPDQQETQILIELVFQARKWHTKMKHEYSSIKLKWIVSFTNSYTYDIQELKYLNP